MTNTEREQHLIEVYNIMRLTIMTKNGPCSALTGLLTGKYKFDREDLVHDVYVDYLKYGDPEKYDPEQSALNSYINKFIYWRLARIVRENETAKRRLNHMCESYDELKEELGDSFAYIIQTEPTDDLDILYDRLFNLMIGEESLDNL